MDSEIIGPNETALIKFLNSRGKYFSISDPDGLRRLSIQFGLPEEDVCRILRAKGFILSIRIPIRAHWARKEVLSKSVKP